MGIDNDSNSYVIKNGDLLKYTGHADVIVIPENVTHIKADAFSNCNTLEEIRFEKNSKINLIADKAFYGCTSLKSIHLPNTICAIGNYAFEDCRSLKMISIPPKVTTIKTGTFKNCTDLKKIIISKNVTGIRDLAFENCTNLSFIQMANNNIKIASNAFIGCINIEQLFFTREDVKQIILNSIYGLPQKSKKIDKPNLLVFKKTDFDNSATEVIIPDGFEKIEKGCFSELNTLHRVVLPASVKKFDDHTFADCISLESVELSENIDIISKNAFLNCKLLSEIIIPCNTYKIDFKAFNGCESLKTVHLSPNLKNIEKYAFERCYSLTEIVIPSSVELIRKGAFQGCKNLKRVQIFSDNINIDKEVFIGCDSLEEIIAPFDITEEDKLKWGWTPKSKSLVHKNIDTVDITTTVKSHNSESGIDRSFNTDSSNDCEIYEDCNADLSVFPEDVEIVCRDLQNKNEIIKQQTIKNELELSEEEISLILKLRSDKQKSQEQDTRSKSGKTDDKHIAINSPLVLKDCSRIISNNIFTLKFSCTNVSSQYSNAKYELYLADEAGNRVSSVIPYTEDPAIAEFSFQFELNGGISFNKNDIYYLTIIEYSNGKSSIVSKNVFHVDITFAQIFDF